MNNLYSSFKEALEKVEKPYNNLMSPEKVKEIEKLLHSNKF